MFQVMFDFPVLLTRVWKLILTWFHYPFSLFILQIFILLDVSLYKRIYVHISLWTPEKNEQNKWSPCTLASCSLTMRTEYNEINVLCLQAHSYEDSDSVWKDICNGVDRIYRAWPEDVLHVGWTPDSGLGYVHWVWQKRRLNPKLKNNK